MPCLESVRWCDGGARIWTSAVGLPQDRAVPPSVHVRDSSCGHFKKCHGTIRIA